MTGLSRRPLRYRPHHRLKSRQVADLLASGRRQRAPVITVLSAPNGLEIARLALIVPKRHLPRAVDRNRTKRLLREWFRLNQHRLGGRDLLIRITRPVGSYEALVHEVDVLFPPTP